MIRRLPVALAIAALVGADLSSASAQAPFVAPEFYNRTRPDFGQTLPMCVLPDSPTLDLDRRVAEIIAESLLLEPKIVVLDVNMDALDHEGIWPDVLVHLSESCVGMVGTKLIDGYLYPDWLIPTAPYLTAPYVLISNDGYGSLDELPEGAAIGSPIYTQIDGQLLSYIATGAMPGARRLPYDRPELAEQLLEDGAIDAAIIWAPYLSGANAVDGAAYSAIGTVEPLRPGTQSLGIALRSSDQMLRGTFDQVIDVLDSDPEIGRLKQIARAEDL
ncbi:transporter substrate-binding domain-containing protein [Pelagibacterium halotolerans]|uniref:Uncharacterized protein n=1 Tax=Pelagibacterium halotolerans (strain DSM 22347 / JCM 15775 / CGMCC 1.7692 / B2) TaxID=1082931 RepID=G4R6M6_PELHB|nr:transporter substrate-binding domain-containing protein [Pelagibacterium halotolerans]AEQ51222.1 hypothetical protein KKY_1192 [Pelagibacterium halotolerans B2]QJR18915.1 transporter substrate-binding domain-containing protein [Pelagibacterium halotolerans]SEA67959.1 extracellular solute-binding protein, family 3 [Pelagibacterium halotolerans]